MKKIIHKGKTYLLIDDVEDLVNSGFGLHVHSFRLYLIEKLEEAKE